MGGCAVAEADLGLVRVDVQPVHLVACSRRAFSLSAIIVADIAGHEGAKISKKGAPALQQAWGKLLLPSSMSDSICSTFKSDLMLPSNTLAGARISPWPKASLAQSSESDGAEQLVDHVGTYLLSYINRLASLHMLHAASCD